MGREPSAVLNASEAQLKTVDGIGAKLATEIREQIDQLADGEILDREKQLIEQMGVSVLTIDDDTYPPLLRHIPDPPQLLYVRGELRSDDAVALAVVGARRCSQYGREQTNRLVTLCSQAGLCIVSGGAYGIDAAAHHAVLNISGRTIAVLGSGIGNVYPPQHADLFAQIASGHGALVSELPMSFPPLAENFPRRNRIISGMALGVLVVEASNRSGALITARLCAEDHGREVMALPGRVDSAASAGCHKMIQEGWANLVTNGADILDALGETGSLLKASLVDDQGDTKSMDLREQNLSESQRRIVQSLNQPCGLDQIMAQTGLALPVIQSDLTMLEIRGLVIRSGTTFNRRL